MKWNNRMLIVTMLAVHIIGCVPTAQAADTFSNDGFRYKVTGQKTVEIIGYDGSDSEPTISSSVDKYDIVGIADSAFKGNETIKGFSIWADLEYIGDYAFYGCTNLAEFSIPSDMKIIGESAFEGCTNLSDVTFWGGKSIGKAAFKGCTNLMDVSIPSEMITIGESAFEDCVNLTDVIFWGGENIEKNAFKNCISLVDISIPSDMETIGESAFEGCTSLQDVTFWGGERIEKYAFKNCTSLTSLSFPSDMESIGDSAFAGCTNLTKYTSWNDDMAIAANAFAGCPLGSGNVVIQTDDLETEDMPEEDDSANKVTPTPIVNSSLFPTASPIPSPTEEPILLQKGSMGEEVKDVQLKLIELGYLKGAADGNYGNQTKAAVEAFQEASSLEITGTITNIEMAMLFASQGVQEGNQPGEVSGNLTVQNCELLAKMLQARNPGKLVGQFMTEYKGRTIEFDGNIAYMSNHDGYKTRYDILILYGDFSTTSVTGPYFQFRDVNYYDLKLTGRNQPDSVCMGQNYRITAEVVRYDASAELIILKPISMELR